MKMIKVIGLIFCVSLLTKNALADDIKQAINNGLSHYQKGEFSEAVAQLNYAASLIQQHKAEQIVNIFPKPIDGWQAEQAESESAGSMMMGGGISASRTYYQGDKNIRIEVVLDSPMIQTMAAMFSNPAMITMSGKKLMKVNGYHAMYEKNGDDIELSFIANNNAMFTISAYGVSKQVVEKYANRIDFDKL